HPGFIDAFPGFPRQRRPHHSSIVAGGFHRGHDARWVGDVAEEKIGNGYGIKLGITLGESYAGTCTRHYRSPFVCRRARLGKRKAQPRIDQARHVFGPFDITAHPVKSVCCAAEQHQSSKTHVSLVPPPWDEFTTRDPSLSATRVRPPGTMRMRSETSTKGRRSTWRGASPLSVRIGHVESASVGCAM